MHDWRAHVAGSVRVEPHTDEALMDARAVGRATLILGQQYFCIDLGEGIEPGPTCTYGLQVSRLFCRWRWLLHEFTRGCVQPCVLQL
eukprot:SAG31_NODE_40617_length_280_cov_0.569061_1_plen_86_part_01